MLSTYSNISEHILEHNVLCIYSIMHCLNILILYESQLVSQHSEILRNMVENHIERNEIIKQKQNLHGRKFKESVRCLKEIV